MIDLHKMAQDLAIRTGHEREDWLKALHRMMHEPFMNELTDGEFLSLSEAVSSPEQLQWLMDVFAEHFRFGGEKLPFDLLSEFVARSDKPLADWLKALQAVDEKVMAQNQPRSLEAMLQSLT